MSDNNFYTLENVPLRCPECGEESSSIKCYSLPEYFICIWVMVFWQKVTFTCCPKCMVKHILVKCFTYNILAANILYPFFILPWGIIYLLRCATKGHSSEIVEFLERNKWILNKNFEGLNRCSSQPYSSPRIVFGFEIIFLASFDSCYLLLFY